MITPKSLIAIHHHTTDPFHRRRDKEGQLYGATISNGNTCCSAGTGNLEKVRQEEICLYKTINDSAYIS